jgi:succinoglycan biosynthesis protein ExoO
MKPDVTIIIPAWNAAHYVGDAIASAIAQTGLAIEVVVADDASTDRTGDMVMPLCGPQVRYIRLPVNGGPSAARNAALALAQGRWIAILDADDAMIPGRLSVLIGAAEAQDLDIITDNMWIAPASGDRELFFNEYLDGTIERLDLDEYVRRNLMFARKRGDGYLKPVFRAAFLQRHDLRYDPAIRIGEDFIMMAEALACGGRYGRHRSAGYVYTTSSGSISHRLGGLQAQAMIGADMRFLAKYGSRLTSSETTAMILHLRRLREGAAFVSMVDAIKGGHFVALARGAVRNPGAVRHFAMPIRARLTRLGFSA